MNVKEKGIEDLGLKAQLSIRTIKVRIFILNLSFLVIYSNIPKIPNYIPTNIFPRILQLYCRHVLPVVLALRWDEAEVDRWALPLRAERQVPPGSGQHEGLARVEGHLLQFRQDLPRLAERGGGTRRRLISMESGATWRASSCDSRERSARSRRWCPSSTPPSWIPLLLSLKPGHRHAGVRAGAPAEGICTSLLQGDGREVAPAGPGSLRGELLSSRGLRVRHLEQTATRADGGRVHQGDVLRGQGSARTRKGAPLRTLRDIQLPFPHLLCRPPNHFSIRSLPHHRLLSRHPHQLPIKNEFQLF